MSSETTQPCRVFLTLTSTVTVVQNEKVVLNWEIGCKPYPDWIGLFLSDPSTSNEPPNYKLNMSKYEENKNPKNRLKNYHVTNITLGYFYFPAGWDKRDVGVPKRTGPKCLPYYIASYKNNQIQMLDCLKIQPTWMSMQADVGDVELRNLFLPGTRCSGCYYNHSTAQSNTIQQFGVTQHFDVWQQLVMGIRYLDISIAYRDEMHGNNKFWITTDGLPVAKLENIIMDIRKFIIYSGEVVVLHFRDFVFGLSTEKWLNHHWDLVNYLDQQLNDVAVLSSGSNKYSHKLKVNDIHKTGRGLIIIYNEETVVQG